MTWRPGHSTRAGVVVLALAVSPALAHPHVFVDGGIDFVFGPGKVLQAVEVTWLYDSFETLYMLSAEGMSLNAAGGLDEADRLELERLLSDWPADFDGSAHPRVAGEAIALSWPEGLQVKMIDGRLEMAFTRQVLEPFSLAGQQMEVDFYESTYFFDFTLANTPVLHGPAEGCSTEVIPFDPDSNDEELLEVLAKLGREETSGLENVGAFFADRIVLQCD